MSHVVIAGGTGLIGSELTKQLTRLGYTVTALSRSGDAPTGAQGESWDGSNLGTWRLALEGAAAVVNLSGSTIAVKWTKENRNRILQSRVASTQILGRAIAEANTPPPVWINGSAIGYYGDRADELLTEASEPGRRRDFLVDTAVAWEATLDQAQVGDVRKVKLRTGIVLSEQGGVLEPLANFTQWFLGGHHGTGAQFMSWIHIKDIARLIIHAIENPLTGAVNAVNPNPCTNRFFMATLRGVMGRPWAPPVPAWALQIANTFGAPDPSLLLSSQRVSPKVALDAGFQFEHDDLRDALRSLMET